MTTVNTDNQEELVCSQQTREQWKRRERELSAWVDRDKQIRIPKQTVPLGHMDIIVDAELHGALTLLKQLQIPTEFSCAGVSILDDPENHSLYAYITLLASEQTDRFIQLALQQMKHRLLVTYEPARCRYDLSSFYIGHNRSFCMLMEYCARKLLFNP
ncbi:hypothetical protein [Paenibacillus periandrae]|uniref:hypothetical protein n=1 Tax=Paenibacillus periandrae TaxID=1761741 RepID=UPI001F08CDB1|nr:hypothetical protein [Paenibacillus periandrae]